MYNYQQLIEDVILPEITEAYFLRDVEWLKSIFSDMPAGWRKKGSKIIDEMFEICSKKMKVGQKESELQTILMTYAMEQGMFDIGYKSTLNPLIIAGGPNGALPHAQVTNRKFKKGDLVVTDLTLRYKGYVSDATRTFALGKISSQANEAYEIVKESQRLGLKAVKPNIDCKDVDSACRKFIDDKNYGQYFIHSTGHGIGLEVHELPTVSYRSTTKLKENIIDEIYESGD